MTEQTKGIAMAKSWDEPAAVVPVGTAAIERAQAIASRLTDIIEQQKLYASISGKKYVTVEGWTTMGAMLGLFPSVDEVRREERSTGEVVYIATVSVRTVDGRVLGRAIGMCSSAEKMRGKPRWTDEYTIMSMAQTRATSKVFRLVGSWIVKMAGYETTPAEEIEPVAQNGYQNGHLTRGKTYSTPAATSSPKPMTDEQRKKLHAVMGEVLNRILGVKPSSGEIHRALKELIDFETATATRASLIISKLERALEDDEVLKNFADWYRMLGQEKRNESKKSEGVKDEPVDTV